jgi:hypothetical protein
MQGGGVTSAEFAIIKMLQFGSETDVYMCMDGLMDGWMDECAKLGP